jgi:excisionase family DNA binding protein
MAGMFYSLKETADRLGKTEDDVRKLARAGKLREFRDGSHVMFKMEEVNALLAEGIDLDLKAEPAKPAVPEEPAEVVEAETPAEADVLNLEEETPAAEGDASSEFDLAAEPEGEASSEMDLAAESTGEGTTGADDLLFLEEDEKPAAKSGGEKPAETDEEIALAPETGAPASESDITDMDTALTGEGVNILGETDTDYDATEDSMAETASPGAATGGSTGTDAEASLEELEEDVNLDNFGSGSGLLDLSLQADDTSLGGILDEIYTAEGGEEGAAAAAAEAGSVEDITAEAEHAAPEDELAAPEAAPAAPAVAVAFSTYAEAAPDTQSNILGMLLILPLLALLYTAIVTISAQRHVMPTVLTSIQGMILYIVGGLIVVSLLIAGASFAMGGERTKTAAPRKVKEAKVKPEKARKENPAREPAAKEKPAKAKKGFSLFGKKEKKEKK